MHVYSANSPMTAKNLWPWGRHCHFERCRKVTNTRSISMPMLDALIIQNYGLLNFGTQNVTKIDFFGSFFLRYCSLVLYFDLNTFYIRRWSKLIIVWNVEFSSFHCPICSNKFCINVPVRMTGIYESCFCYQCHITYWYIQRIYNEET